MKIKVIGSGCANCKRLLENVQTACKELVIDAEILYVTNYKEILSSGLLKTPGLVINGRIVSQGRVPASDEVKKIIQASIS